MFLDFSAASCIFFFFSANTTLSFVAIKFPFCVTMHPQLRSARFYIAQQRSAAQCGAVPCPSFSDAVSCGAVRSFGHTSVVVPGKIQVTGVRTCYVYCSFCFLQLVDCPLGPHAAPPANITRTVIWNVTSTTTTAQRKAISSAQAPLGIIS